MIKVISLQLSGKKEHYLSGLINLTYIFISNYDNITSNERHIILHAKKSLLYNSGEAGDRKVSSNFFDVTMGSYYGVGSCELVGTFLLHKIKGKYGNNLGLYRDDGLGIINAPPCLVWLTKKICVPFSVSKTLNYN